MRFVSIHNETRSVQIAARAGMADSYWLRLRGLLGRPPLTHGEGLLITPCRAVHMLGMKYAIDVAFLDRDGRVVGVNPALQPGARSSWYRGARQALELPSGTLERSGTAVGDRLSITAIASESVSIADSQPSLKHATPHG